MTSKYVQRDRVLTAAMAELRAGKVSLVGRTGMPFMATVGAMVIGILLAVAAIVGVARSGR